MNVFEFYQAYPQQLADIASMMTEVRAAQAAASEAAKDRNDSLTSRVRGMAQQTHNDGIPVEQARSLFTAALKSLHAPEGSVKASGNHFAGYRILLAEGKDISNASTAEAQEAAASPEVRALKQAKREFNKLTKKWTLADWQNLLEMYGETTTVAGTADAEIEQQAREAA